MNDEIKEIFEEHLDSIVGYPFQKKDKEYILDYITNLQQEIQKKEAMYDSLAVDYRLAQEENERLKEENKHIFSKVNDDELLISNAMNYAEAQDYKSRVEKAIEYIKPYLATINWIQFTKKQKLELLNILQNGSDEE